MHGAVDPQALLSEGVSPEDIIDFSSNQAPAGIAAEVARAVRAARFDAYPDPRAFDFCRAAAARHGVGESCVVAGNGTTELIRLIAQLTLGPGDVAMSLAPSFGEYVVATALTGARLSEVRLVSTGAGDGFHYESGAVAAALEEMAPPLCWICSPNNPTGALVSPAEIVSLVRGHPGTLFVLDEAYCDLLAEPQWSTELLGGGNLVVLRSMTKVWGLAGLRLGYALAHEEAAAALRAAAPPWSVNACAQAAGVACFREAGHYRRSMDLLLSERDRMTGALRRSGWIVEPSQAGFFLVRVGDAMATRRRLLQHGLLLRDCASFGLPDCLRLSPRGPGDNDRLLAAFATLHPATYH